MGNEQDRGSNFITTADFAVVVFSASVFTIQEKIWLTRLLHKLSLIEPNSRLKYVSENISGENWTMQ